MRLKLRVGALLLTCMIAVVFAVPLVAEAASQKTSNISSHTISAGSRMDYWAGFLSKYITVTSTTPSSFFETFTNKSYFEIGYYDYSTSTAVLSNVLLYGNTASGGVTVSSGTVKIRHSVVNRGTSTINVVSGTISYY